MSGKRKFSTTFEKDLDITQSLLKYRKTSTPVNSAKVSTHRVTQEELRSMIEKFVSIYEQLDTRNSANMKPNYTYTEMIFFAVMRSPNFCLPITEIYRYIETRFLFFKETSNQQWKNAVRHSLSKTKCFQKIGLKHQKPRNGILNRSAFLWTILPRSLLSFARGDYRPTNKFSGSNSLRSAFNQVNSGGLWEACVATLMDRMDAFQHILNQSPSPAKVFQLQVCNTDCDRWDLGASENCHRISPLSSGKGIIQNDFVCDGVIAPSVDLFEMSNSVHTLHCQEQSSPTNSASSYDLYLTPEWSDSSDYLTFSELTSPEPGYTQSLSCQWSSSNPSHAYWSDDITCGSIPEVTLECIDNVPMIPFLPPIKLSFVDADMDSGYVSFDDTISLDNNYIPFDQDIIMTS